MLCRSQAKKEAEAWRTGVCRQPRAVGEGPYKGPEPCAYAWLLVCVPSVPNLASPVPGTLDLNRGGSGFGTGGCVGVEAGGWVAAAFLPGEGSLQVCPPHLQRLVTSLAWSGRGAQRAWVQLHVSPLSLTLSRLPLNSRNCWCLQRDQRARAFFTLAQPGPVTWHLSLGPSFLGGSASRLPSSG